MISCRAPGKLFVAGEYAVLEPGYTAMLVAVDRFVTVAISDLADPRVTVLESDLDGGIVLLCQRSDSALCPSGTPALIASFAYVLAAIEVFEQLLAEWRLPSRAFRLSVRSELGEPGGRKYGLGSSAAVTVATVAALDCFYHTGLGHEERFRIALLATLAVRPTASGADVAASVWGGWIAYSSPDRWLITTLRAVHGIHTCLRAPWPQLSIRHLRAPESVRLLVGWTGQPASTDGLAGKSSRSRSGQHYHHFLASTESSVRSLIDAVTADEPAVIAADIRRARTTLMEFDDATGLGIMTPGLHALCRAAESVGAAAKSSGAGGGDCGIAVADAADHGQIGDVQRRWEAAAIQPLPLRVYTRGRVPR
ncbi:phosphomevalonate kinase [Nocardia brasiliensis]|uniref:phosphomevalonate kinase n=1 Tax=Nocardia brasiliensis TaxID=37326 RepID=UPI00245535F2|nr:phosphomevalonate kinase [Nocardia brasiliensis]